MREGRRHLETEHWPSGRSYVETPDGSKQARYGSCALGSSSLSSIFSRVVRDFAYFTRLDVTSAN
jgi:hypothetical protein